MNSAAPLRERLRVLPQYFLPQHLLSRIVFVLTRWTWKPWKDLLIRAFIHRFQVDMTEAERPEPAHFTSFNDFFTRALKHGARPVAAQDDALTSPVDGVISQSGNIQDGRIIQAKGMLYSAQDLLVDAVEAAAFAQGRFATLYLAPRNYHRVHLPVAGRLVRMSYVPGRLFSVGPAATDCIEGLFARNERIVCLFDTDCGPMVLCMVGALFVGSMDMVWHGQVTPSAARGPLHYDYRNVQDPPRFDRGAEIGRFNMGSTVILLFAKGAVEWAPELGPGSPLKMGQRIGQLKVKS